MKKLFLSIIVFCFTFWAQSQLVTSGTAAAQSCDCYTVTEDLAVQAGGIWSPNTIDLNNPFDFSFEVYLGATDLWGADGIVFVLQQGQTNPNNVAQNMAYSTISPSVGIEIDTWENANAPFNDPPAQQDHVTILTNGDFSSVVAPSVVIPNIEDGAFHTFQVVWDPVLQVLAITLDGNFISAYNGDIINGIFAGNPNVYFGFTGATGGATNLQQVCVYREAIFTPTATNVCLGQSITFNENSTSDLNQITNYDWDFDDTNTSTDQNPTHTFATAGTYDVALTITDITGCTDTETIQVVVSPGLNINVTETDVTCNGADDGELLATPTNGTGPFGYVWDIPSASQNPTGLAPNTYNVTVTDNIGCTGIGQGVIDEPTALSIDNVVGTDASCGLNNGTLTITASGGSGNFNYSINGGAFQASNVFTGLGSAGYTVEIQDANSLTCIENGNGNVGLASSFDISPASVVTDVSCGAGANDGEIAVTVINGAANYTYDLTGPVNQNQATALQNHTFTGLTAGSYNVSVTDNSGCVVNETNISVNSATAMTIDNIVPVDATCNGGADGEIEIFVTGGAPTVTYSIDGGANFQNSATFTGLAANNYAVQVLDGVGCIINDATVVGEPAPLSIDNVVVDNEVLCNAGADGQVTVTASGGNGVYTYSIDGGITTQASNVFTGLTANNYIVTLLEGVNCTTTTNGDFTIIESAILSIDNIAVTDVTCNGLTDGSIIVTASGGTPNLVYSIDGGATQITTGFSNLGVGTFTLELTDGNNCPTITEDFEIIESAPLSVALGNDTTICDGTTGDLCAIVTGGTAPYSYYWNGVTIISGPECLPTNTAGAYTLEIEDANGCTSINTATQSVALFPALTLTVGADETICPDGTAPLFAEANGGNGGPYTYTWVANIDGAVLDGPVHTVSPSVNTTYDLSVTDGCTVQNATATTNISLHTIPNIVITATPQSGCSPLLVEINSAVPVTDLASQTWSFGNGETGTANTSSQTYVDEGCYTLDYAITTTDGCSTDTTLTDFICVHPYPVANFEFTPEDPDLLELQVDFLNQSSGATIFNWDFGTGSVSSESSPSYTYPEYGAVDYEVELTVSNDFGCSDSISKTVHVTELQYYYIPNALTPNGINSTFRPEFMPGFIPHDYDFVIFNRWGEVVYSTNDIYSAWNGIYNGSLVEDGTYVWQITFRENETDKKHRQTGHVTVLY